MSYTEVEVTKVILTKKVKDFGQLAIKKRGILDIRTRITSYIRNRLNLGEPLILKISMKKVCQRKVYCQMLVNNKKKSKFMGTNPYWLALGFRHHWKIQRLAYGF